MEKYLTFFCMISLLMVFNSESFAQYTNNDNTSVYTLMKEIQDQIPEPKEYDTIYVGEFDPATGHFDGLKTIRRNNLNHPMVDEMPTVDSYALNQILKFKINPNTSSLPVIYIVNGVSYRLSGRKSTIYLPVTEDIIRWEVTSGNKKYNDALEINIVPLVAAGVMKIPFLPIALIYEPSPDNGKTTFAEYSITDFRSTSLSWSFSEGRSRKTPELVKSEQFKGYLDLAAKGLSKSSDPYAKATAQVLNVIVSGWGSKTVENIEGTVNENKSSFTSLLSSTSKLSTGPNDGGPGIGDILLCLQNCRLLWLINGNQLTITILDHESPIPIPFSAFQLKRLASENPEVFGQLASINPFIQSGINARLSEDRYRFIQSLPMYGTGGPQTFEVKRDVKSSDGQSSLKYSTRIEEVKKGWLGYMGISPNQETYSTMLETKHFYGFENSNGKEIIATLNSNISINETIIYDIYLDKVFGTFVMRKALKKRANNSIKTN